MKKEFEEMLDIWTEEELKNFLPEQLPELDEMTRKRIEKRTLEKVKQENRRFSKKQIVAAVVCIVAVLGIAGRGPILAAFEKLFHYLPGVGVYVDEEGTQMYSAELIQDTFTENGVTVTLKNVYAKGIAIHMELVMEGENLTEGILEGQDDFDYLKEKYPVTMEYNGTEYELSSNSGEIRKENDENVNRYRRQIIRSVSNTAQLYTVRIAGFETPLVFRLTANEGTADPETLGVSQTKSGITLTASAEVTEDGIAVELYQVYQTEEIQNAETDFRRQVLIYGIDYGDEDASQDWIEVYRSQNYVENKDGAVLKTILESQEDMQNGLRFVVEGTEADFPITIHRGPTTVETSETQSIALDLPETGETKTMSEQLEFAYGTVEILEVSVSDVFQQRVGTGENTVDVPRRDVEISYRVVPKEGVFQMYAVSAEAPRGLANGVTSDWDYKENIFTFGTDVAEDQETLEATFADPYLWAVEDFTLVIDTPKQLE
ncbi:hypothetical protein H9X85_06875 [Anaerotignum lactatifermentans]|uniref:DUF4179 domain-containing protein n=1 Tax=Anaerotignum lactatifermentans TaxID=160404 RepID=A0ABS2G943_9FIRM|nr:hypothetical protein [Anaerotignum lactatifermentans]MBM6829362.1 hypothetical protein [Anaerotignum lactatifermentans]MBM6877397.1 hypothetical protein [Anaerotignum lactatifermentans]MBM6950939.1 hypothetical protein [Anaerotignum lactatifermentans]